VRLPLVVASTVVCVASISVATLAFDLSFSRAALLAPVLVASVGALAALLVLWGKAARGSVRRRR
jgi:hypothetical protein